MTRQPIASTEIKAFSVFVWRWQAPAVSNVSFLLTFLRSECRPRCSYSEWETNGKQHRVIAADERETVESRAEGLNGSSSGLRPFDRLHLAEETNGRLNQGELTK